MKPRTTKEQDETKGSEVCICRRSDDGGYKVTQWLALRLIINCTIVTVGSLSCFRSEWTRQLRCG